MSGPFSPDAESAGKRALRSAILDLLVGTGERAEIDRALPPLSRSHEHDRPHLRALDLLASRPRPRRGARRFLSSAGRTSRSCSTNGSPCRRERRGHDSVETVQGLLSHPKFSLKNPNRVRALIGSFVNGNPTGFNRADGAGYEFLAGSALQIDRFNPHMAARLLGAFESWRTLEPRRQGSGQEFLAAARLEPIVHRQLRNCHKNPRRRLIRQYVNQLLTIFPQFFLGQSGTPTPSIGSDSEMRQFSGSSRGTTH